MNKVIDLTTVSSHSCQLSQFGQDTHDFWRSVPVPPDKRTLHCLISNDYQTVQAAQLTFSSTSARSQSFTVTINTDDLTELREIFKAVIIPTFILRGSNGAEFSISQLESRIQIGQARVAILDRNCKRKVCS
jgi:hypothetical protein